MKKILIPVDFSKASECATRYALGLAKDLWADVHLLHVYQPPLLMSEPLTYGGAVGTALSTQSVDNLKEICTDRMGNLINSLKEGTSQNISYSILEGNPVDEIINLSQKEHFDLIVMSTHGESALYRALFGSVTAAIIRRAETPVFVVPKDISYTSVKRVAYASNQEITDGRMAWRLNRWLKLMKPEMHVVHIVEPQEDMEDKLHLMNKDLDKMIHVYDSSLEVKCHVVANENIDQGLECFMEEEAIDLLVVKTHNRNLLTQWFMPSMAKHLLFYLNKPMMILHE